RGHRRAADRQRRRRHAVGPGRQGRGPGPRPAGQVTGAVEQALRAVREGGRKILVPYVTGGLGADWPDVVRAVGAAGADAIEVGIPFSDPVLDGPTIQEASQRALDGGAPPAPIVAAL